MMVQWELRVQSHRDQYCLPSAIYYLEITLDRLILNIIYADFYGMHRVNSILHILIEHLLTKFFKKIGAVEYENELKACVITLKILNLR